jgi:adenylate cyclase
LSIKKRPKNYDEELALALRQTPTIGGYIFTFEKNSQEDTPVINAIFVEKGVKNSTILEPKGVVLNIPILQDSMYSSGFFNNTPDYGGMIRSVPLVMRYDDTLYPSLALEMVRIYSGVNRVDIVGDSAGLRYIKFGEFKLQQMV